MLSSVHKLNSLNIYKSVLYVKFVPFPHEISYSHALLAVLYLHSVHYRCHNLKNVLLVREVSRGGVPVVSGDKTEVSRGRRWWMQEDGWQISVLSRLTTVTPLQLTSRTKKTLLSGTHEIIIKSKYPTNPGFYPPCIVIFCYCSIYYCFHTLFCNCLYFSIWLLLIESMKLAHMAVKL